jgi:Uma2 family endonuclease
MITSLEQLDLEKRYTYADYLSWQLKERVELIKGRIFRMSPAPSVRHQQIVGNLFFVFKAFLKNTPCQVFVSPFDVRLIQADKNTVVQPDICVICDKEKLDEQGCNGAPDLIIEILSPGNSRKERKEKFELYEENGVKEYWLVETNEESIIVYTLNENGQYIGSKPYVPEEVISSSVLPGLEVPVKEAFE